MKLQLRIKSAAISIAIRCGMLRRIAFSREDDTEPEDVVAAVPKSGTPEASSGLPVAAQAGAGDGQGARPAAQPETQPETERAPVRRVSARRLLAAAAVALAVALLFLAYLRVSRTYPENSDESNDLLMAWDMLHGNVLLHGWYLSDVSFITTELPQYALLVWLFGLHTDTAHIAAAMTYTLVVILSVLLARGRVPRREGRAADAADGGPRVRPSARRRRLRPAAVPRAHRHRRAAPADLAGHRPVPARGAGADRWGVVPPALEYPSWSGCC